MIASGPLQYRRVFERLDGLVGSGPRWNSRCPAHDDDRPSLSITLGRRGQLLLKCHAPSHRCTLERIVAALGVRVTDLFLDTRSDQMAAQTVGERVAAYDYRDEQGGLLLRVVRFKPKDFRQCRPNPAYDPQKPKGPDNSEFLWNAQGVRLVPYRLQELLAAIKKNPGRWVFVMEGEKDCDLAWKNNILATCNPMGAGKWGMLDPGSLEVFRGTDAVVIADDDEPGLKHAEAVCESLRGIAKTVRLLRLPQHDFSDWWEAEGKAGVTPDTRRKMLGGLANNTPLWGQPAKPVHQGNGQQPKAPPPSSLHLPASGAELLSRLRDYEAKLAKQGVCSETELVSHVVGEGVKAGFNADAATWGGPAIEAAVSWARKFEEHKRAKMSEQKAAPSDAGLPPSLALLADMLAEARRGAKIASRMEWLGLVSHEWAKLQQMLAGLGGSDSWTEAVGVVLRMGALTAWAVECSPQPKAPPSGPVGG